MRRPWNPQQWLLILPWGVLLGIAGLPVGWTLLAWVQNPGEAVRGFLDPLLWSRLAASSRMAFLVLAIALPTGMLQGWLLARCQIGGRFLLLSASPVPLLLPPLVHAISWCGGLGWRGSVAWILVHSLGSTPVVLWLTYKAVRVVPGQLVESLRLDGGNRAVFIQDIRAALPSAWMGCLWAFLWMLGDYSTADYLSAMGPKQSVYADSIYSHYVAWRTAGISGATLPGLLFGGLVLLSILRSQHRLVPPNPDTQDAQPALPLNLGVWRNGAHIFLVLGIGMGTVFPVLSLLWQISTPSVLFDLGANVFRRFLNSLALGAWTAILLIATALPLAWASFHARKTRVLQVLCFLPFALHPLQLNLGFASVWNQPGLEILYQSSAQTIVLGTLRSLFLGVFLIHLTLASWNPDWMDAVRLDIAGRPPLFRLGLPRMKPQLLLVFCLGYCLAVRDLEATLAPGCSRPGLIHTLYSHVVFASDETVAALALLQCLLILPPTFLLALFYRR